MDRNTALGKLQERFEEEKEQLAVQFQKILAEHYENLIARLYEGIERLDEQYPIHILQFQIMRTDLYQGKCKIRVCAYDEKGYLDEKRTEAEVEIPEFFAPFQETADKLSKEISVYMGSVTDYDIRNLVCEHFIICFLQAAPRIRQEFLLFDEWAKEQKRIYQLPYRVVWGVYRGAAETLFAMDKKGKTKEDMKIACEGDKYRGREGHLFFAFPESRMMELKLSGEKFAFLNMKNSFLSQTSFEKCTFGQSMFRNTEMEWSSFAESIFYGCNFSEMEGYQMDYRKASITNSSFAKGKLRKAQFEEAILTDVSFADMILEECSFKNAVLKNVDLRVAAVSGIDFTGASMENVYVHAKDVKELKLTEEQAGNVFVLKEEVDALL